MKIYYNAMENVMGISVGDSLLLRIDEQISIFRVVSDKWELVGEV